jgi:pimeloyl-ACP methyl ester carboxylesterase
MKILISLSIILLISMWANESAAQTNNEECTKFLQKLPAHYKRGFMSVPENWLQPNGRKIKVFYYTNWTPGKIPAAYFYGGPLGVDHSTYTKFDKTQKFQRLEAISKQLNIAFIYIDQRGTGCSDPVPQAADFESNRRASFYSTDHIVRDAEALRISLVGEKTRWKVVGQSWGGQIANRYVMDFPKSIISAHNYAGGFVSNFVEFMYHRMLKQQQVAVVFMQRYPASIGWFKKIKAAVQPDDCLETSNKSKVCGHVLLDAYYDYFLGWPPDWPLLMQELPHVLTANGRLDLPRIQKVVDYTFDFFFSSKVFPVTAVWRQEANSVHPSSSVAYDCSVAYEVLRKQGIDRNQFLVDHCRVVMTGYNRAVNQKLSQISPMVPVRKRQTLNDFINALRANPHLNYYVYSGGIDYYDTQTLTYQKISKERQVKYTHFPNEGHYGYYTEPKFWSDLVLDK